MSERLRFVQDARRHNGSFAALCRHYAISRKTGYKWVHRTNREGTEHVQECSRRPHTCPHAIAPAIAAPILELRRHHPDWGPRTLVNVLRKREPDQTWPARSTVADLLRRAGLVSPRRRRRFPGHPGRPLTPMTAPNGIWTADFKGQCKTGDGIYCYPLTVQDGYSRYLRTCRGLSGTTGAESRPVFERLFREYGLPQILRTDNGVPFATEALHRLSQLSVWWIRLGIYPELIEPGRPQQNGRHERMHRTLKCATARPPASSRRAQQRRFDIFRQEYNEVRPHQALHDQPPASLYTSSPRPYPEYLAPLEYPAHYEVRRVSTNGGIRWQSQWVNVSHVLGGEYVGLLEIDDAEWDLYFGPVKLGRFHERLLKVEDALGRLARHRRKTTKKVLPMSLD